MTDHLHSHQHNPTPPRLMERAVHVDPVEVLDEIEFVGLTKDALQNTDPHSLWGVAGAEWIARHLLPRTDRITKLDHINAKIEHPVQGKDQAVATLRHMLALRIESFNLMQVLDRVEASPPSRQRQQMLSALQVRQRKMELAASSLAEKFEQSMRDWRDAYQHQASEEERKRTEVPVDEQIVKEFDDLMTSTQAVIAQDWPALPEQ